MLGRAWRATAFKSVRVWHRLHWQQREGAANIASPTSTPPLLTVANVP